MAAALLRKRIAEMGLADQIEVQSAGVWASQGQEASKHTAAVMADHSVSLGDHRSQPVTISLLERADIVLVMEETHRRSLFYLAPQQLGKVFLLSEMAGRHEDVADPYGGPREQYVKTAALLEEVIHTGLPGILKRIGVTEQPADH
jgi:protein-tyrosine-phosphatase